MHCCGWAWHGDHHEPHGHRLEKNDRFALVGAAMSTSMFAAGSPMILGAKAWEPGTWIGLGILFYGILYTLRSEEHTSELQSLMRISYAVFCLKKKKDTNNHTSNNNQCHYMLHTTNNYVRE